MVVTLIIFLFLVILMSIFFSAAETAYIAVSRHKLKDASDKRHYFARLAHKLLRNPDSLLSFILLGNNLANVAMTTLVAVITIRYINESFVFVTSLLTTFFILIFCEITPKSFAYRYPYQLSVGFAGIVYPLQKLFNPVVWCLYQIVLFVRRGLPGQNNAKNNGVNIAELRGAVVDARGLLSQEQSDMLINILDLNSVSVEDAMTTLNNVEACDLNRSLAAIKEELKQSTHSHLLVFRDNINSGFGFLDVKKSMMILKQPKMGKEQLVALVEPASFVPTTVNLLNQLKSFSQSSSANALVVDEYGVLQGMITLKDLVAQITGWLGTRSMRQVDKGIWIVEDSITLRALNNKLGWNLYARQAKTLKGLILERLDVLPARSTCIDLGEYRIEIGDLRSTAKDGRLVKIWRITDEDADRTPSRS